MKKSVLLLTSFFVFIQFPSFTNIEKKIKKTWETSAMFQAPESIVYDPVREVLYISNFNDLGGFRQPGDTLLNEYISKIDLHGNIINLKWIDGLIGPTGLVIYSDTLFAVERGFLTKIDIEKKQIIKRISLPDFGFPNDVTVDSKGIFYITDSSKKTIYKIKKDIAEKWLVSEKISGPNGILFNEGNLIIGVGDNHLKSINIKTKEVNSLVNLGEGIIDGIKKCGNDFLVSHYQGNIYRVTKTGEKTELLNTREQNLNCADFEFIEEKELLVIPALLNNKVFACSYK